MSITDLFFKLLLVFAGMMIIGLIIPVRWSSKDGEHYSFQNGLMTGLMFGMMLMGTMMILIHKVPG